MQINVSAQADHPLFVWSLLLLKSENQFFFFYLIYRRITGEPEVAEHFETWGGGGLIFYSATRIPLLNFSKMPSVLFVDTSNLHNV